MTRRIREHLRQLGSIDALSWPVFWLTLFAGALGLAVHNFGHYDLRTRMVALVLGQVALWLPLSGARVIVQASATPRPALVVAALIIGLAARIAVIGSVLSHASSTPVQWANLYLGAFTNVGFMFVVSAIVVSTARENRRQIHALGLAQAQLGLATEQAHALLAHSNEAAVERVRGILLTEVDQIDAGDARGSLAVLQHAVGDVVRPLSREIERSIPALEVATVAEPVAASWRDVVYAAAQGRPFRPVLTAVLLGSELAAATAILPAGAAMFALAAIWCAIAFALANTALARVLDRLSAKTRLVAFVGAALAVGMSTAMWLAYALPAGAAAPRLAAAVGCFVVVLGLATAIASAAARDRTRVIGDLESASFALTCNLVRSRQVQWFQQKSLSRALHGPVQTAMAVAAIRLGVALRDGVVPPDLIASLRTELLASLDHLGDDDRAISDLRPALERIQLVWDGVCNVGVDADSEAATLIDSDPVARSVVNDIAAEAVSNATRHGHATQAEITVGLAWTEAVPVIELGVHTDSAVPTLRASAGLGTRMLDDCTLSWSLDVSGDGSLLTARIPGLAVIRQSRADAPE